METTMKTIAAAVASEYKALSEDAKTELRRRCETVRSEAKA